ncbi:MAG: hypothetical protein DRG71_00215 [Deltaproteobacteria bacterium]|nr:MAG: hypothetical protein DRG71_00215 [Deltaproteobacteria bacterium]
MRLPLVTTEAQGTQRILSFPLPGGTGKGKTSFWPRILGLVRRSKWWFFKNRHLAIFEKTESLCVLRDSVVKRISWGNCYSKTFFMRC